VINQPIRDASTKLDIVDAGDVQYDMTRRMYHKNGLI